MKLKKTLSGVLAAAMVVSLTPAMAFASTTNTVATVPTVSTDTELPEVQVSLKISDETTWSTGVNNEQIFKLTFNNAEWNNKPTAAQMLAAIGTKTLATKSNAPSSAGVKATAANLSDQYKTMVDLYSDAAASTLAIASGSVLTSAQVTGITAYYLEDSTSGTPKAASIANIEKTGLKVANTPLLSSSGVTLYAVDDVFDGNINDYYTTAPTGSSALEGLEVENSKTAGDELIRRVYSVSDNSIEFGIYSNSNSLKKDDVITVTFLDKTLKSLNEAGPVEIAIDGLDSKISSGTVTVATVGSGKTVATTNGDVKSYARKSSIKTNTTIEIRESSVNALKGTYHVIKLTLPKGIEWADLDYSGSFGGSKSGAIANGSVVADNSSFNASNQYYLNEGKNILYVSVPFVSDTDKRQVLTIQPYITITKDAAFGDISVDIDGWIAQAGSAISSASDLKIAAYGDETVTISTDETIPSIVAGYIKTNKEKPNWIRVTLKENIAKAISTDRPIDFTLPTEVQVATTPNLKWYVGGNPDRDAATNFAANALDFDGATTASDRSFFTLNIDQDATLKAKMAEGGNGKTLTLYIPVTVQADYSGDITLNVSGAKAGIEDTDIVVATAESPITVTSEMTEVKNGVQSQALSDIVITENKAGYLGKGGKNTSVQVSVDDLGFDGISITEADVKVTDGNLEINNVKVAKGVISFNIKESSSKASTITISNVVTALNRTMPEGPYDLNVYGSALIDNNAYNKTEFSDPTQNDGDVYAATVKGYVSIVTPADSVTVSEKVDAKFVIGEASYTNNGTATEMDAAAYIDSHNRTMVPIRYVANACGISENDIRWEAGSQTAIINGLNTVVTVKMGSNKLQTSTGEITMDTVAVNNNGRIYVPVRYIANALGANVSWDAATKTVTLTK